jgi:hypothetical protein
MASQDWAGIGTKYTLENDFPTILGEKHMEQVGIPLGFDFFMVLFCTFLSAWVQPGA